MVDATDHKLQLLRPVTLQLSASFASPFGSTRRVSCPSPTRHCHFSRGTRSARQLINLSAAYRSFLFKGKLIISHLGTYPTSPSLTSSHPRTKSSSIGILILAKIPPSSELHALSPFCPTSSTPFTVEHLSCNIGCQFSTSNELPLQSRFFVACPCRCWC